MNRAEFIASILLLQFKLRRTYVATYDLHNVYIYAERSSNHISIGDSQAVDFHKEYHGNYNGALKYAIKLLNR